MKVREELFHYVWKHKLFRPTGLVTTNGREVEIVDVGLHNHDSGPDFFNAKVRIGQQMWVGNVELHIASSQWYQHGHDHDRAYDNVVLHVTTVADCEIINSRDEHIPQIVVPIPPQVVANYETLLSEDRYPRCHKIIPALDSLTVHSWLAALHSERLERKTLDITRRLEHCQGSWEDVTFQTLARYFGFGVNSEAFEAWAKSVPLQVVSHHRDDEFQVEALFFGQAGLLDSEAWTPSHRAAMEADDYFQRLRNEYLFLQHKFSLQPIDGRMWRFMRLRPQNFATIRLSQLAHLHCSRQAGMSQLLACKSTDDLRRALATEATGYWKTHYTFGEASPENDKRLSRASADLLLINAIIPLLFAYGRYSADEQLVMRAMTFMEQLRAEDNQIVRMWAECGLKVDSAADSQALIQLKREYCDRKDCLRCRIGYRFLKTEK